MVTALKLNISKNLAIDTDFRSNTILNLGITDGASLFMESVSTILNDGISAKIRIADNTLENGAILFAKDMVKSAYNSDTGKLVIQLKDTSKAETLNIQDSKGNALTGLNWSEVSVNGKDYYELTGMVPEPAQWAAIFGAFVLALAFYRRRK